MGLYVYNSTKLQCCTPRGKPEFRTITEYRKVWEEQKVLFEEFGWKLVIALQFLFGPGYEVTTIWQLPDISAYKPAMDAFYRHPKYQDWLLGDTVKSMDIRLMEEQRPRGTSPQGVRSSS